MEHYVKHHVDLLVMHPYDAIASDIWSTGVILYAMLTGQLPWTKRNQAQLYKQIKEGDYKIPNYLSDQCIDLIQRMMCVDSSTRITSKEILNHPWLEGTTQTSPVANDRPPPISLKSLDLLFDHDSDSTTHLKIKKACSSSRIENLQTMHDCLIPGHFVGTHEPIATTVKLPQLNSKAKPNPLNVSRRKQIAKTRSVPGELMAPLGKPSTHLPKVVRRPIPKSHLIGK